MRPRNPNRAASPMPAPMAIALAVSSWFIAAGPAPANGQEGGPSGVVYVQSNVAAAPGNAILAYKQHHDGSLSPLPGSPYSTGGAGISPSFMLGPYDSDQEIVADPGHEFLYATNGGSDTIAVFRIGATGRSGRWPARPSPPAARTR